MAEAYEQEPGWGDVVRFYTSGNRKSYMDGVITDSHDGQYKVWFTSKVVRGGEPREIEEKLKRWLSASDFEVIERNDFNGGDEDS